MVKQALSAVGYVAKKWLWFAGVLTNPAIPRMRFADQVDKFARWMTEEKGMSELTARSHQLRTSQFLK